MVFRAQPRGRRANFTAELTVSRLNNNRHVVLYRSLLPITSSPAFDDGDFGCPWCSRVNLFEPVIRDERGTVGKVFLLRLDLADMPSNSQTIIRQKHYYNNSLDTKSTLKHGLQVAVRRIIEQPSPSSSSSSKIILDRNGDVHHMKTGRLVERTELHGSVRFVFSFNQAATITGGDRGIERDACIMKERLEIITEHLIVGKYAPIPPDSNRIMSTVIAPGPGVEDGGRGTTTTTTTTTTSSSRRVSQHGQIL